MWPTAGSYPIPKGMEISGSAAWFSKADVGITVHRGESGEVEVHCWKVRFKWIGKQGMCFLGYDVATGRYSGSDQNEADGYSSAKYKAQPVKHWQDDDFDRQGF